MTTGRYPKQFHREAPTGEEFDLSSRRGKVNRRPAPVAGYRVYIGSSIDKHLSYFDVA